MKCAKCGSENLEHAIYCSKCGNLLASVRTVIDKNVTTVDFNKTAVDTSTKKETVVENAHSKKTIYENITTTESNITFDDCNKTTIAGASAKQNGKKELKGWVVCVSEDLQFKDFCLYSGQNTIGRSSKNNILLSHQSVSTEHGVIWCDGNTTTIVDKNSTNGLLINGERIFSKYQLKDGDLITIGDIIVQYVPFNMTVGA